MQDKKVKEPGSVSTFYEFITQGLTDRDAPSLYGKVENRLYLDLWQDKVDVTDHSPEPIGQDDFLIQQLRAEFIARYAHQRPDAAPLALTTYMIKHPVMDFLRAVVDGLDRKQKIMVRFAIQNREAHEQVSFKGLKPRHRIPVRKWIEIQHQLAVTQFQKAYFASSVTGREIAITEVPRDEIFISNHVAECILFWDHVKRGAAPEYLAGKESETLNAS